MAVDFSGLHHVILANASRLIRDATFLYDNSRFASAFFLAVLGIEEVGKATLNYWDTTEPLPKSDERRRTAHVRKQAAISCLLLGSFAVKNFAHLFSQEVSATDDVVANLTKSFNESEEGRLFGHINQGMLDKTKQLAVYQDTWQPGDPSNVDRFDNVDVESMFVIYDRAVQGFHDPTIMSHGRKFYEVMFLTGR
jgi:AbiV family abortive infection protein